MFSKELTHCCFKFLPSICSGGINCMYFLDFFAQ
jgi:hypothetical protein